MDPKIRKYFKYLDLVREDIREELDTLNTQGEGIRICDYGCGNGITTFGLGLEIPKSQCIGVDLFNREIGLPLTEINQYLAFLKDHCNKPQQPKPSQNPA
jgi:hypothetical protein